VTRITPEQQTVREISAAADLDAAALADLGGRVARFVIDRFVNTGEYPRAPVDALSGLASSGDSGAEAAGGTLIFTHLVEGLSDQFSPLLADLYDRVFAQIIQHQRQIPGAGELDERLRAFGLSTEEDIYSRRLAIRHRGVPQPPAPGSLGRIVVLSRVTLGADVAVTSVLLGRLREIHPDTPITLIAPRRIRELFAQDPGIEILESPYPRRGPLVDRLLVWVRMMKSIGTLEGPGTLFVDPDSRLTQLGLLPLTRNDAMYRIFESRTLGAGTEACLGQLAADWAARTFGGPESPGPYIRLGANHIEIGKATAGRMRGSGGRRIVAISFGVGGNTDKRSGDVFERGLVLGILAQGHRIVLDLGIDSDLERSRSLLAELRAQGVRVLEAGPGRIDIPGDMPVDVLAWDGGVGQFSALVREADLYAGYDSAFQHIAAALDVPVVAVVLGSPGPVFRARWTPYSEAPVRVVPSLYTQDPEDPEDLAARALDSVSELLGA